MIALLNQVGRAWAPYFGWALFQNTVFLGIVLLTLHALRRAPARVRYGVGMIGLCKLLLPPFLPYTVQATEGSRHLVHLVSGVTAATMGSAAADPAAAVAPRLEPWGIACAAWITIGLLYLLLTLGSTVRLVAKLRSARPLRVEDPILLAGHPRVRLYLSDQIRLPMTLGILPGRIFLPPAWRTWSPECRRMVVRHELAHLWRRDGLFQWLEVLARSLYFFHPLVHVLIRQLRIAREMACDDISVDNQRSTSLAYSRALLRIAESTAVCPESCAPASALLGRKSELRHRIEYQMGGNEMDSRLKNRAQLIGAMLVLLILPLSWYARSAAQQVPLPCSATEATQRIEITIDSSQDDRIEIDSEPARLSNLKQVLEKKAPEDRNRVLVDLRFGPDVPMTMIHEVHRVLRGLSLLRVNYRSGDADGMPLALPSDRIAELAKRIPEQDILDLRVEGDGEVELNRVPVRSRNLRSTIVRALAENEALVIRLRTSKATTYGGFLEVMAAIKAANAQRVLVEVPAAG